ncbi:response regulator transcription factor [Rhodopseudomonas boonkerdii]|uniref:response regulator transcription factor n=1 Tax=Rhodopseudomonas boonkerdii TaxID=475937 RepID=UPI001E3B133C|nr:response regulator transcription factor [Rhodopseudomonas boonkerdii]UGV28684.1 response regulator transcription factor [Rhodopseudomonas boonkerdii]
MRVLLVEDEPEMVAALRTALARHGMLVDHAPDLYEAELIAIESHYDAIVLDRQLPDGDGLSLISKLRERGNAVPVLVLTARGELADRVTGLDKGADDYLGKPFAFEEFLARLRALLRRPASMQSDVARIGRLAFDANHREASVDGRLLEMPRRELLLLEALLQRMGRMVLRSALMAAVYSLDDEVQPNALDTHVSRLRRRLAESDAGVIINGVRGLGYVLRETP